MTAFPAFMKHAANRIATSSQHTPGVEGYVFDGVEGSQMAFWTVERDARHRGARPPVRRVVRRRRGVVCPHPQRRRDPRRNGVGVLHPEGDNDRGPGDGGDTDRSFVRGAEGGARPEVVASSERSPGAAAHARMLASASAMRWGAFGRAYIRSM